MQAKIRLLLSLLLLPLFLLLLLLLLLPLQHFIALLQKCFRARHDGCIILTYAVIKVKTIVGRSVRAPVAVAVTASRRAATRSRHATPQRSFHVHLHSCLLQQPLHSVVTHARSRSRRRPCATS